jgi:hypothetical protein
MPSLSERKYTRSPIHIGLVMLPVSSVMRRNVPLPVASIQRCPAVPPR